MHRTCMDVGRLGVGRKLGQSCLSTMQLSGRLTLCQMFYVVFCSVAFALELKARAILGGSADALKNPNVVSLKFAYHKFL